MSTENPTANIAGVENGVENGVGNSVGNGGVENPSSLAMSTLTIHADDELNAVTDVAPPIHVSTTFRYPRNADKLEPVSDEKIPTRKDPHIYSRATNSNSTRLEVLLGTLLNGHALTYTSGLSSFFALITYLKPRVVAINGGYHGCHGVLSLHNKLYGVKTVDLFSPNQAEWDEAGLGKGDIIHVETPVNPTGEARDLAYFAKLAKERGAYLTVDATFAPPPLLDPFKWGADAIMHSGTKYFGGHSDLLCGVLVVQNEEWFRKMWVERVFLGSVLGSLEGWLGVRSVRTLELRVRQQSANATNLVKWLHAALSNNSNVPEEERKIVRKVVHSVQHSSVQALEEKNAWINEQMPNGHGPVFALSLQSVEMAKTFPGKLQYFHHATSLGGVESLVEWRRMSDKTVDPRVLRFSIGIEGWEDLKQDIIQGLEAVANL